MIRVTFNKLIANLTLKLYYLQLKVGGVKAGSKGQDLLLDWCVGAVGWSRRQELVEELPNCGPACIVPCEHGLSTGLITP